MKKCVLSTVITSILISSVLSVSAANIPRESAPCHATEENIIITENLINGVLAEVQNGLGYADAKAKSNRIIFHAVISKQTNGNGYAILTEIANNAIFQYRDMYLRPVFYAENEEKIRSLISDIISEVENGTKDYSTAVKESRIRIYHSVNPAFNPDEQFSIDTCYRDIPPVDSALFTIARKLLLEVQN